MTQPNRADLAAYLDMIFGYCDPGEENAAYCIALRGLGEKGTDKEGDFRDIHIVPPIQSGFDIDRIFGHVQRWSQHGCASFIVPACVAPVALSDPHATEDRILALTTIVVDIDKGDTDAKLAHAVRYLGQPSMVVLSGGTTETGHAKIHAYWRLSEASDQVERIAAARKLLALKIGGDAAFGRSTQVIRLPGSIYNKNNAARPCRIDRTSSAEYDLEDILQAIEDMPVCEGIEVDPAKVQGSLLPVIAAPSGGLNFSGFKNAKGDLAGEKADIGLTLTTDIKEGGDEDRNRWSEFNRVAGIRISDAREGRMTLDAAKADTWTWVEMHMKPAWPPQRFETEWRALLARDIKSKGAMSGGALTPGAQSQVIDIQQGLDGSYSQQPTLEDWRVDTWAAGEKPKRQFLVDGLVLSGKAHMLAAEGGAGKTFLLLDLAAKIASHGPGQLQSWCGLPLSDDAGGTVVMFTTEDDKDELHIRLADIIDKDRLKKTKGRLIIIPTINIGGAFALVERQRAGGPALIGAQWGGWLKQLEAVKDLKLVIIDTLNTTLHGEENSATVINEYIQAAAAYVCGKFGASLIVTHHVRKPGANIKIYTAEDMKNSIRGSTALIGAFRVVLGMWHAPDYAERMERLEEDPIPGRLYNFAVVKANNPEMEFRPRTMLRHSSGMLFDVTDREREMVAQTKGTATAWIIKAVEYAAAQYQPFTTSDLSREPPGGRKHQAPKVIRSMSQGEVARLVAHLVGPEGGKRLVKCAIGTGKLSYLDVPGGPLANNQGEDGGAYKRREGEDFKAPDWEATFTPHATEDRIVPRGRELDNTLKAGTAEQPTKRPDFNPNKAALGPQMPLTQGSNAGLVFSPDCSTETMLYAALED